MLDNYNTKQYEVAQYDEILSQNYMNMILKVYY